MMGVSRSRDGRCPYFFGVTMAGACRILRTGSYGRVRCQREIRIKSGYRALQRTCTVEYSTRLRTTLLCTMREGTEMEVIDRVLSSLPPEPLSSPSPSSLPRAPFYSLGNAVLPPSDGFLNKPSQPSKTAQVWFPKTCSSSAPKAHIRCHDGPEYLCPSGPLPHSSADICCNV